MGNCSGTAKVELLESFENWNKLPPEIKLECMKHLDFKTRFIMRSVSRTERILVDSHNFKLDSVRIEGLLPYPMNTIIQSSFDTQKITIKSGNHEQCVVHMRNRLRFNETIVPLLVFILKNATINDFSIETILNIDWSKVLQDALNSKSLSIRSFSGVLLKFQEAFFFVNKLNYTSKSIYLDGHGCKNFPIDQLISIESVSNASLLQIRDVQSKDIIWKIANKWIETDAAIGTRFQLTSMSKEIITQFSSHFKNRIISASDVEILIRTDNPMKHILLKLARTWRVARPFTCIVISAETEQSEFVNFGMWVSKKVIPLWEYISLFLADEFNDDDGLNLSSFLILLLHCIWLIFSMLFKRTFYGQ
ncbi:F-box domain-containing protein [Caenorhabditis elegans]|uniref:F-box domain-containing protein n=1 Tax=Caenorhabditis elegans TaxID=6239 RepID=O01573_CAEEL|nr:F-box domain-containing protein [Caenorhabditis elegans]CCD62469.1 F-box domain-containing protein [Caenorhabditis elegans]|eukprot:NP_491567.2 F-box A protein [Caenorhabditis elegans]